MTYSSIADIINSIVSGFTNKETLVIDNNYLYSEELNILFKIDFKNDISDTRKFIQEKIDLPVQPHFISVNKKTELCIMIETLIHIINNIENPTYTHEWILN